jgi:hypothetical protein
MLRLQQLLPQHVCVVFRPAAVALLVVVVVLLLLEVLWLLLVVVLLLLQHLHVQLRCRNRRRAHIARGSEVCAAACGLVVTGRTGRFERVARLQAVTGCCVCMRTPAAAHEARRTDTRANPPPGPCLLTRRSTRWAAALPSIDGTCSGAATMGNWPGLPGLLGP